MSNIAINSIVRRQTVDSPYSHYIGSEQDLVDLVENNMCPDNCKAGYRDGVLSVSVPPKGFFTGVVTLEEGDKLVGEYRRRVPGETPRKTLRVSRLLAAKSPAIAVDIILYRHDVLAEKNEFDTNADWEVVSINARITKKDQPIRPMTLLANHYGADGGTATKLTAVEFEKRLQKSYEYWQDKAMLEII